jgi:hypothetical protein
MAQRTIKQVRVAEVNGAYAYSTTGRNFFLVPTFTYGMWAAGELDGQAVEIAKPAAWDDIAVTLGR